MRGSIYKLECSDGKFYIGSTIQDLELRLWEHKKYSNPNNLSKRNQKVYEHIRLIGWDNVKMILIEEVDCDSLYDIRYLESEYIRMFKDDPDLLNMCLSYNIIQDLEQGRDKRRQLYNELARIQWYLKKEARS